VDLRPYIKTERQLKEGIDLINSGLLFYQPFILADDVEVGEGQNFHDQYQDVKNIHDLNVYAPAHDVGNRTQPADLPKFRQCNEEYRSLYEYVVKEIENRNGGNIKDLTFAEIGCNTGLSLFSLAKKGAKSCFGYDWNDMHPVFNWLNNVLGTNVGFRQAHYDNLYHRFMEGDVPEVDVMINTIFTNHQCDPIQFLSYMCDRARKGVFLWALIDADRPEACIVYPNSPPHDILDTARPFPLYFNNDVRMSEKLLHITFKCLGFDEVETISPFVPSPAWQYFQTGFRMYYAKRTRDMKSAYWHSDLSIKNICTLDTLKHLLVRLGLRPVLKKLLDYKNLMQGKE